MPIFEYACNACGNQMELLVAGNSAEPECIACGSRDLRKMLSVPSSLSGVAGSRASAAVPAGCCGVNPEQAGCAGPGSCCGRNLQMT